MTLSDAHANKSRTELVEEIMRLNKELRARNEEIATLKKRILLYKSIK
ncbi:MAG TPA: hypothetical protein VMJ94_04705 [Nitrososphaera sp.]|nr:hypothetical protein [Nitrososphaera sp.]